MRNFERLLLFIAAVLAIVATVSTLFIASDPSLVLALSGEGLKNALDHFAFPIATFAGAIAIVTIYIAVGALIQSMRQNAGTAWEMTQNNFISYAGTERSLPMSAFSDNPFTENFESAFGSGEMVTVKYQSPITTVRRLYDAAKMSSDIEPVPNQTILTQVARIETSYEEFHLRLSRGEVTWLASFVDLAITTRQLRLHLVVTTRRIQTWSYVPVLEFNPELGPKRYLPPFSSGRVADIAADIFTELLCIVDVLHFSQRYEAHANRLLKYAFAVGGFWQNADDRLKVVLTDDNGLHSLWSETHQIIGARVSLATACGSTL